MAAILPECVNNRHREDEIKCELGSYRLREKIVAEMRESNEKRQYTRNVHQSRKEKEKNNEIWKVIKKLKWDAGNHS